MGTQRHINGHAGAHVVAQHFNYFADRFGTAGWTLGQLDHHHVAHTRAHDLFRRDQDIEAKTAVIRHHEAYTGIGEITADDLAGFRHQHANDARFATPLTIGAQRLGQHLIAMDTHFHLLR